MAVSEEIVRETVSRPEEIKSKGIWLIGGKHDCPHDSLIHLGVDKGSNTYFKCNRCEGIVIMESPF